MLEFQLRIYNGSCENVGRPQCRLLAMFRERVEMYDRDRLERAVRELDRTRTQLKDISVDCYIEVQVCFLLSFSGSNLKSKKSRMCCPLIYIFLNIY